MTTLPENKLLSVQQAAVLLKVSIQTLRRWDQQGILVPQRTPGGQRRYTVSQIKDFKKNRKLYTARTFVNPIEIDQISEAPATPVTENQVAEVAPQQLTAYEISQPTQPVIQEAVHASGSVPAAVVMSSFDPPPKEDDPPPIHDAYQRTNT
jgi:DNA-binding transcriptional MerR regulator